MTPHTSTNAQKDPQLAKLVDIQIMINELASTGEQWIIDTTERAIGDAFNDFKGAEIAQLLAIYRLMDLDVEFDQGPAIIAQHWLIKMFPNLGGSGYGKHPRTHRTRMTYGKVKASLGLYIDYQLEHPDHGTNDDCESYIARHVDLFHEDEYA